MRRADHRFSGEGTSAAAWWTARHVRIFNDDIAVRAQIHTIGASRRMRTGMA